MSIKKSSIGINPKGTTVDRPSNPATGDIFSNTQLGYPEFYNGTAGTANTGGGGGGRGSQSTADFGAAGGSGVVIIRYAV